MDELIDILPENLSEDTVTAIATLVESKVSDKSKGIEKALHNRFMTFMTENIDRFKDLAIKELEAENDTFKAAKLFAEIKRVVANEVMDEEIRELIEAKDKEINELKSLIVDLKDYVDRLEETNSNLTESVEAYENADLEYFVDEDDDNMEGLEGDGVIVQESEESDNDSDETNALYEENEFLSEDVLEKARSIL